jgi:hypothetical protein
MLLKILFYTLGLIVCLNMLSIAQEEKTRFGNSPLQFAVTPDAKARTIQHRDSGFYLVRLKSGVKKSALSNYKIEIARHLEDDFAIIKSIDPAQLHVHAIFDTILYANHLWKLSNGLLNTKLSAVGLFTVRLEQPNVKSVMDKLSSHAKVVAVNNNTLQIACSVQFLREVVIAIPEVLYVGEENFKPQVESRVLDLNLEPNTVYKVHHEYPQLNGAGKVVSIKELSYNPDDIDLDGRHVSSSVSSPTIDIHATEMATIVAGAGNSFVTGRGVARAAQLTSSDFVNLFPDPDSEYQGVNAWVQNHSYGTIIENSYGALAEAYDLSANRNPELLHVFSSGNKGNEAGMDGMYQGISGVANITGNFKMAKNVLVVGSVDTVNREIVFASRGPAYDGRVKPELVAYSMVGSSNSAALTSGVALLLQQAYEEETGMMPPAALLKAILINSARDAGAPGIDFITGYGNVDSYRSIQNLKSGRYVIGSIGDGEADETIVSVPANARNLKVSLVWNDPAALPNSDIALVNDLDLNITDPMGGTWLPWVLDASPDPAKLSLPATRNADHLNVVEQVTIASPASGDFVITVSGFDIPAGPQEYYIAYQWDTVDQFEWLYPTGSDNMPYNGETPGYFRWKSTRQEDVGTLELSIDNGNTWSVIRENVDLSKGHYRWLPPPITSRAHARMTVGSTSFITHRFTISRPVSVGVGFNCTDSVMLQWNSLPEALEYEVYTFNEAYLEPITVTNDTTLILYKDEFPSRFYTIQPKLVDGTPLIRSYTFDYSQQGVDCFVQNFFSQEDGIDGILLTLQLGTVYGIDEIHFEREVEEDVFTILESVTGIATTTITYADQQPKQGYNRYRARMLLQNEEEVITDMVENFFLTESPYAVFPNPVSRSVGLTINTSLVQDTGGILRLYTIDGRLSKVYPLISDREVIDIRAIHPGLYFYSIEYKNQKFNGKLSVHD